MATAIDPTSIKKSTAQARPATTDSTPITDIATEVLTSKRENFFDIQKGFWGKLRKYDPGLIGGDIFTAGYLGVQFASDLGVQGLGLTSCVMGSIAGLITVYVGSRDLFEGVKTLQKLNKSPDATSVAKLKAARLILVGISEIVLGLFFIIAPLIKYLAPYLGISAFLIANPWLLSLLFVIPTILMFIDMGTLTYKLITKSTLAQQLNQALSEKNGWERAKILIEEPEFGPDIVKAQKDHDEVKETELRKKSQIQKQQNAEKIIQKHTKKRDALKDKKDRTKKEEASLALCEKILNFQDIDNYINQINIIENLDAQLGPEAALDVYQLYIEREQGNVSEALIHAVQKRLTHWTLIQSERIAIQLLYLAAFGASLATIPQLNLSSDSASLINVMTDITLLLANFIPTHLDSCEPFLRNTNLTVPAVTIRKILKIRQQPLIFQTA